MAAPLSGQKVVTTAGTAVVLAASRMINAPLMVKALDTNTGIIAVGNDDAQDVTVSNGLRLAKGEAIVFDFVGNLATLWIDSAVNGEGVSWCILAA